MAAAAAWIALISVEASALVDHWGFLLSEPRGLNNLAFKMAMQRTMPIGPGLERVEWVVDVNVSRETWSFCGEEYHDALLAIGSADPAVRGH